MCIAAKYKIGNVASKGTLVSIILFVVREVLEFIKMTIL